MTLPDYVIAPEYMFVECKQEGESWSILDFTSTQISVLNGPVQKGGEGYLFLELGDGNAPDGRGAWLVEWRKWLEIQHNLLEANCKSLRFESTSRSSMPTASGALMGYELEWQTGGWAIPEEHPFWQRRRINHNEGDRFT
jgi:hypothetical protein